MIFPISLAIVASTLLINPAEANPLTSQSVFEGALQQKRYTNLSGCRCFPGDTCWPALSEWTAFNQSLGDKLIATIPIASPCHNDAFGPFDAQQCAEFQSSRFFPETHFDTSSSVMAPNFTNDSCNPFLTRDASCLLGNYISYAVNASGATDFQKTVEFVQKNNIRLTVRNTGHDYSAKATGAGAIGMDPQHESDTNFRLQFLSVYRKGNEDGCPSAGIRRVLVCLRSRHCRRSRQLSNRWHSWWLYSGWRAQSVIVQVRNGSRSGSRMGGGDRYGRAPDSIAIPERRSLPGTIRRWRRNLRRHCLYGCQGPPRSDDLWGQYNIYQRLNQRGRLL